MAGKARCAALLGDSFPGTLPDRLRAVSLGGHATAPEHLAIAVSVKKVAAEASASAATVDPERMEGLVRRRNSRLRRFLDRRRDVFRRKVFSPPAQ